MHFVVSYFFQIIFLEILGQKASKETCHQSVKHFVRPDLGPKCLERLSADDTSKQ